MKGRWKRLNENGNKWVAACREANARRKSGISDNDVEKEAHSIYEAGGSEFLDLVVFNEVMRHQISTTNRRYCDMEREFGAERLINDYFSDNPTRDATDRVGLSSLQKCTGAMRVLVYGTSSDVVDEYLRMSSSSTRDALVHFMEGVISCFGGTYLRRFNEQDLARLLYVGEQRGFPGMIDNINAWAGQYTRRSGTPTIILKVVTSYDL
ncbi:uncharacterized protein LOC130990978 [Salvia miltiorrhiza]|uniref:uncharacterized protein LOC130990978 n=1 Tax=Salvia miltiorrhiza TaxID=226208 RepID=UPI0025ACC482|nr:uncharacterized protein LOC130990978 [Salvia miltiorrhiza]